MRKTTENSEETLEVMLKAADRQRPVTISYIKEDGTKDVRTIEIFDATVTEAGNYLLHAMDRERQAKRTFRVDRITHYTIHTRLAYAVAREVEEIATGEEQDLTLGQLAEREANLSDLAEIHGDLYEAERHWENYLALVEIAYLDTYEQAA